jgi:hypothetical protein
VVAKLYTITLANILWLGCVTFVLFEDPDVKSLLAFGIVLVLAVVEQSVNFIPFFGFEFISSMLVLAVS